MSDFTDYEEEQFFSRLANLRCEISRAVQWKKDYEKNRDNYPSWVTKDGEEIKVRDLKDSHLDNLLKFVPKRDPNNETKWVDILKSEKRYRTFDSYLDEKEAELSYYEEVMEQVY